METERAGLFVLQKPYLADHGDPVGGLLCLHVRIETAQKPEFPQCIQCRRRQKLDLLRPFPKPVVPCLGHGGIQMCPLIGRLRKQISLLGEL